MNNDAAQLYYAAQACLIELEHRCVASESVLDEMRDRMDRLWLEMNADERQRSRELAAALLRKLAAS